MTIHLKSTTEAAPVTFDETSRQSLYRSSVKRLFDIVFSVAVLPLVVPVLVIVGALIALDGGSPFFIQRRVGKDGKVFRLLKLRSMVIDAEAKLVEHLAADPEAKREWDEKQKLTNDPRVTRIGQFIRKSSIDELPQFLNVLVGDMSVVGPRPMLPSQREMYPGMVYYAMKPGVTGFWQVGDRHATSFADRARYDIEYYRQMSLWTDLRVVLKTLKVVVCRTGA